MKLLGFIFSDYPNVSAQIDNLISRANKRVFVLRYYAAFMPGKDLVKLYCSLVSSILEYSSVTYHSMLTRSQVNRLENVQKRCLKCIFGYGHTYPELLGESGLQTLKARRETAVIKFAQKLKRTLSMNIGFVEMKYVLTPETLRPIQKSLPNPTDSI